MKLISFDIGIKNMAYCILTYDSSNIGVSTNIDVSSNIGVSTNIDVSSNPVSILDWTVINLLEQGTVPEYCTCILAKSLKITKKQKLENHIVEPIQCGKLAKFQKAGILYCEKHAKLNTNYFIPKKIWMPSSLKKLKMDELCKMCGEYNIQLPESSPLKKTILEKMNTFFLEKCYELIIAKKDKTSLETDLITIGRNMKMELDKIQQLNGITHVIMENQISPIAVRMKTVQGMLAQYFIMKFDTHMHIEFVSSVNKLRFLGGHDRIQLECTDTLVVNATNSKSKYKEHKLDGQYYSNKILENNEGIKSWKTALQTKKKDDLADCFLQGLWYMHHKKLISVNEKYIII